MKKAKLTKEEVADLKHNYVKKKVVANGKEYTFILRKYQL